MVVSYLSISLRFEDDLGYNSLLIRPTRPLEKSVFHASRFNKRENYGIEKQIKRFGV